MKAFENPEIELTKFEIEDVITTSGEEIIIPGENQTPGRT